MAPREGNERQQGSGFVGVGLGSRGSRVLDRVKGDSLDRCEDTDGMYGAGITKPVLHSSSLDGTSMVA